ncbi:M56 family metallopeptidase [Methanocaldococcus infernus]|uniref:M56 family metallopeptidase n=1 Tax=Methanocaldococcus infernus TaxID=67760 RepID=UPI0001A8031D|nr:M56 family metallopeptidase [Methanocaldococcus infernus]
MRALKLIFILLLINSVYSINVSVNLDSYGWIKIESKNNISPIISNLSYLELNKFKEDSNYFYSLKVPLDKKREILTFNFKNLSNLTLNEVSCAKFLKINDYSLNGSILRVKYSLNLPIIILCIALFLIMIVSTILISLKIKALFKSKPLSVEEKSKVIKKYNSLLFLNSIVIAILFLLSLIVCDSPLLLSYFLNISPTIIFPALFLVVFLIVFIPIFINLKEISNFYDEKVTGKEYLKTLIVLIIIVLPIVGVFIFLISGMSEKIIEPFKKEFYNLPFVLRISFWIIFYSIIFNIYYKLIDLLFKKVGFVKVEEADERIKSWTNELSKKLNVSPPKKIEVIKSPMANAYIKGLFRERLVLTTKLLESLNEDEIKGIIAHELAHRKKIHVKIGFLGNIVITIIIFSILYYFLLKFITSY